LYEYFEAGLHRNRILEIEDLIAAQNRWIVVAPERRRALFELFQALGDLHLHLHLLIAEPPDAAASR
jgi:hypothetical protein